MAMTINIQSPYEADIKNSDIDFTLESPKGSLGNKDNASKYHVVTTVDNQKIIINISCNQVISRGFSHNAF